MSLTMGGVGCQASIVGCVVVTNLEDYRGIDLMDRMGQSDRHTTMTFICWFSIFFSNKHDWSLLVSTLVLESRTRYIIFWK